MPSVAAVRHTDEMPRVNLRLPGAEARVAQRVAYERDRRGWSYATVARLMGEAGCPVNPTAIHKIEKAGRTISLDEAVALAKVFGFDAIDDLAKPLDESLSAQLTRAEYDADAINRDAEELTARVAALWRELRDIAVNHATGEVSAAAAGLIPRRLPDRLGEAGARLLRLGEAFAAARGDNPGDD